MGDSEKNSQTELAKDATPEIPNGGLKAWLQVVGCFFLTFNTWCVPQVSIDDVDPPDCS